MLQRFPVRTSRGDSGSLSFIEGIKDVPFEIARIYYLHGIPSGASRGCHAHRRLEQVMIAIAGRFRLRLHDGERWFEHEMKDATQAIHIPQMFWREIFEFSHDAVCLVLASRPYEEEDYIRDFDLFLREIRR